MDLKKAVPASEFFVPSIEPLDASAGRSLNLLSLHKLGNIASNMLSCFFCFSCISGFFLNCNFVTLSHEVSKIVANPVVQNSMVFSLIFDSSKRTSC